MGKTFSDVILVVKEPIDPSSLPSKYCKLKKMLSTKTYLEWPQQVNQQAFFWEQLRTVLGKPTMNQERGHSVKSRTSSVGGVSVIVCPEEGETPKTAQNNTNQEKNITFVKGSNELSNERQIPVVVF